MMEEKTTIKFVIVGDHDVGKTSIVTRYTKGSFDSNSKPTIGAACIEKDYQFDGKEYVLSLWDTAGQETYRNLVPMYYRSAQIALIVCDLTRPETLRSIDYWINSIQEGASKDVIMALIGNKADLEAKRKVEIDDLQKISNQYKIPFFETSAVTGLGISKIFEYALSEYMKKEIAEPQPVPVPKDNNSKCC